MRFFSSVTFLFVISYIERTMVYHFTSDNKTPLSDIMTFCQNQQSAGTAIYKYSIYKLCEQGKNLG
jgi:hypothetical protein